MVIKTKLTEKDFIAVNFIIVFSMPVVRVLFIIMAGSFILNCLPFQFAGEFSVWRIIVPLFVFLFVPAATYFVAKQNYVSSKRPGEQTVYYFEAGYLRIQGESFSSQLTWDKVHKVTETKKWLLIWQSAQMANAIRKTEVKNGDMHNLKRLLNNLNVKNNLH